MTLPVLSLLLVTPLVGAILCWCLPAPRARWVGAASMAATLLLAVAAVTAFNSGGERFQLVERMVWIHSLQAHYLVGVDGLSVLFLPSTAFLFLAAAAADWNSNPDSPRLQMSLLLVFEALTLGVFCALDGLLFLACWELSLIPIFFLLGRWGATAGAARAAGHYFLLMLAGGIPLVLALVLVASQQPLPGFDLVVWLSQPLPESLQKVVFLLFLAAFGLKVPLVPAHTWLARFSLAAPGSLVALLVGLKLGVYGLIRLGIPLAPLAAKDLHWLLAGAGTVTLLYGAVSLFAQTNLRLGLVYAGVSHAGFALIGLSAFHPLGVQGAVAMMWSFPLAAGGGMIVLEFLRRRTGTTDIHGLGGAAKTMPLLAGAYLMCGLTGMGLPGTVGFPGELLVILAAVQTHTGAGLGALFGLGVATGGFLRLFSQAFYGPATRLEVTQARDLLPREWAVVVVLLALTLGCGLFPAPWLEVLRPAAEAWIAGVGTQ